MIWVTWRQHRAQAVACLVLFGSLAALAAGFGIQMRTAFRSDGLPGCLASSGGTGCGATLTSFVDRFAHGASSTIIGVPLTTIPGLLGVAVGAPLLGRELERGTWRLAWSQTVPRTRWLVTKLGLVTGGLVVFGAAVSAVVAWYHAARRLYESCGFIAEGILREEYFLDGRYADDVLMTAMVDPAG